MRPGSNEIAPGPACLPDPLNARNGTPFIRVFLSALAAAACASATLAGLGLLNSLQRADDGKGGLCEQQYVVMEKVKPAPRPEPSRPRESPRKTEPKARRRPSATLERSRSQARQRAAQAPQVRPLPELLRNLSLSPVGSDDGPELPFFPGAAPDHADTGGIEEGDSDREFAESEVDSPPIPLSAVSPAYPELAMREELEGHATAEFVVNASGEVVEVTVVDAAPRGVFDRSVRQALLASRFRPATAGGRHVICRCRKTFRFNLWN